MISTRCRVLFCLLAASLFAAGCGGAGDAPDADKKGETKASAPGADATDPNSSPATQPPAGGQDISMIRLGVGSPAPPLSISSWVKGDKVGKFDAGKVYVVEFWATWCGPCRMSMPHLSTLQQQYGDKVQLIGISDEKRSVVDAFMTKEHSEGKTWNDVIQYTIALDQGTDMGEAYMEASGQSSLPTAYVVGKSGKIEWIGHPMEIDGPLEQIVSGSWDLAKASREYRQIADFQAAVEATMPEIRAAEREQDWGRALAGLESLIAKLPTDVDSARARGFRYDLMDAKHSVLGFAGRLQELEAFQEKLVSEEFWNTPDALDAFSWKIATDDQHQDLELAMKAATRANQLAGGTSPSILDTIARIHFERGELADAVRWQQKAVEVAPDVDQLAQTLAQYQQDLAAAKPAPPEPAEPSEPEPPLEEADAE